MGLDRSDIKKAFDETRPKQFYDEFVPLWHMVRGVQQYMREKQTPDDRLPNKIQVEPSDIPDVKPLQESNKILHILYNKEDPFKARLIIAKALGEIVLQYIPEKLGLQTFPDSRVEFCVLFFAQKMLGMNADMKNGALLRRFSGFVANIPAAIEKEEQRAYPLEEGEEETIETRIKEIFPNYPKVDWGGELLRCEMDIIAEYMVKKSNQMEKCTIKLHPKKTFNVEKPIYSQIRFFDYGFDMWYVSPEDAEFDLANAHITDISPISLIRLVLAHELGHAVLRNRGDGDKSTAEREASYFARLLLRRREKLYNNGKEDKNYADTCNQWDNLFRHVHRGDDELIDWVLAND